MLSSLSRGIMVPLLTLSVICWGLAVAAAGTRENLLDAAVTEVKAQFAAEKMDSIVTSADKKLHSFKMSTRESQAQGEARLKFEEMVKNAEKKIIVQQRNAAIQTAEERVESLAMELMHRPGSVLTKQEVARMYQESGCESAIPVAGVCGLAEKKGRRADGTCNNLQYPLNGAANTAMRRLIPARYDDGISRLQGTLQIQGLSFSPGPFSPPKPSPRIVSLGVVEDREVNDTRFSHILMQWGQFMDHDMDAIPEFEDCGPPSCTIKEGTCVPFPIPQDDRQVMVTRVNGSSCHMFRRSLPVCDHELELKPREQVNSITHFIDGSMVYSHNSTVLNTRIRNQSSPDGLLNVGPPVPGTSRPSLPFITESDHTIACPNRSLPCFLAGDFRVNEHVSLTVMHTLWVREHNRIALALRQNNNLLSSDEIFRIARNIVIAQIQKITYKDFVPILLGGSFSLPSYAGYDKTVNPNIPNAFATAAYRFGHSQIQPLFDRLDSNYESISAGPLSLVDSFFDASQYINNGGTDPILRGLLTKNARKVDEFLNSILTNRLFSSSSSVPGLDLASLNIQRGRDHGLPSYSTWKQWAKEKCGVESDFQNQLTNIHFLQNYGSLNNVDLFVGGLAEKRLEGGLVGAVFACIFRNTFSALRNGDRFYYENSAALFSEAQRREIEKASLSRVICDNSDINEIQRNAFATDETRRPCSQLPSIDLMKWNQNVLPERCLIRVRSGRKRALHTAVSYFPGATTALFSQAILKRRKTVCMSILCPIPGGKDIDVVVASTRLSCVAKPNENLKESKLVDATFAYGQSFSANDIRPENGLYTSLDQCNDESVGVAVVFCANQEEADTEIMKDLEDLLDVEKQKNIDAEEVVSNDPEKLKEELREMYRKDGFSEEMIKLLVLPATVDREEKLIAIMESVLQELKGHETESKASSVVKTNAVKEDSIISELEDALKKDIQ